MSASTRSLKEYTSCLHIHDQVVRKHIKEDEDDEPTELQIDTAIPFTINIIEKVFLAPDKDDMDEKEEPDKKKDDGETDVKPEPGQDEEDAK